ncbi:hypothetical protein KAR91_40775 [Candidatus Pacearchaeota archaeon]|nr:hypothetical protein [Candidatus Pacearchaeota archaeon]
MARYDFENILDNVDGIITSKLNTKITSINTEKDDGITVSAINNNAHFLQTLDERVANFDPFLVYGIDNIEADADYNRVTEKILIAVTIVMADNGKTEVNRILFRYSRALKEIFLENWQSIGIGNRFKISALAPVPFDALDSSAQFKAIGILIETGLST